MASEKNIKHALDLLTTSTRSTIESLAVGPRSQTKSLIQKVSLKNVVAVGISEKISKKKKTGQLALTFYVEKKLSLTELREDEVIPKELPDTLSPDKSILTDVIEIGKIHPEVNSKRKPIQPGYSIGHIRTTAGTLGAIVTNGKDLYVLSNSHVLAQSGQAKKGDKILYPGKIDGGKNPGDVIAKLHDFIPFQTGGAFVNNNDCAIAKLDLDKVSNLAYEIKDLGVPTKTIKPKRGMRVVKVGRTTGKTEGRIKDINFRTVIDYEGNIGNVGFVDQVLCTRYTDGGDSGSLVFDKSSKSVVGLHFAGSEFGSIFNPIDRVLSDLKVKFAKPPIVTKKQSKRKSTNLTIKK